MQDPALLLGAQHALGTTLLFLGEYAPARLHLEQALARYDPQQHRALAFLYGRDLGVMCLARVSWALWCLGYPDQARQASRKALTLAQELAHPASLAFALDFAAVTQTLIRDGPGAYALAEAAVTLCTEHGFAQLLAMGQVLCGWALAIQGQLAEGLTQLSQGLAAWAATGSVLARPHYLALLGEVYGRAGQIEQGLAALAEALAIAHTNREEYYEAEIARLQGALLWQAGRTSPGPEASWLQAIATARRQEAKAWELRAAMNLCRMWQQQGKCTAAYELLAPLYGWFTEGFDTADLQEAKTLLEALAG